MKKHTKNCIICNQPTTLLKELPSDQIVDTLITYGIINESNLGLRDYALLKCMNCDLEFAEPMIEPSSLFYTEITKNKKYYPTYRWEWGEIILLLNKGMSLENNSVNLLDVGCGSGTFLELMKTNCKTVNSIGIDSTASSIDQCKQKGLNAFCSRLDEFKSYNSERIDVITLWHVLEHVADPVELITTAKSILDTNGSIYFSVPLSPTSYEALKLDPLNLPPHHLTRWSISSLNALAKKTNMSVEFTFPKSDPLLFRVIRSTVVTTDGVFKERSKEKKLINLLKLIIKKPMLPFNALYHQLSRTKYNKKTLPDVILVKFKNI
ncbi:MAG TPA: hypothetical protein DDY26_01905 [Moraxellaceae bacterium]|nr:class I SAM-dependent methyltransferase [Moraxella sp.]HBI48572.1 hypothetical protein [Moraxellaceae bacterium]